MGVSKATLYRLMGKGILPWSRFEEQGKRIVDRHDIDKLFLKNKTLESKAGIGKKTSHPLEDSHGRKNEVP